jgi:antitoxin component YwqK of YwqJK toxin-antitoxin module
MTTIASSIPTAAEKRVTEFYPEGGKKAAEYTLGGEVVGTRHFYALGAVEAERILRDGQPHGPMVEWHENGQAAWVATYVNGLEHGTAWQWAADGTLVGEYHLDHGTGLDLWWTEGSEGRWALSEARYVQRGARHGFEWLLNDDQASVFSEGHYWAGQPHGILREWNAAGRLRRGFPQYWVNGLRVMKRQYLRAVEADATLPRWRAEDNAPGRKFPREIVAAGQRRG